MESVGDGWRDELQKYFRSVENFTEKSLLLIKRDRIRNNLPFDDSFKKYFLDRTNSRIANAYTNFLYEERLEEEVNQQRYGNGGTSIGHQLIPTIIGPESIEHMPIILVQSNNQNLASNTTASATTFVLDGNQMSDQIIIPPPPSNQAPSVPSEVEIKEDLDQELRTQSTECTVVEDEPTKKSETTIEALIEPKRSKANTSAVANNGSQCDKSLERMVNSNIQNQVETIDLTSDQEEMDDTLNTDRSNKWQAQQQRVHKANAAGNSNEKEKVNCLSHRCQRSKCEHCVGQSSKLNFSVTKIDRNSKQQSNDDIVELTLANDGDSDNSQKVESVVLSGTNIEPDFKKLSNNNVNVRDSYHQQKQDNGDGAATDVEISNKQFPETIKSIADQEEAANHDQSVDNIAGSSQITKQKRNREDDIEMSSGQLKKKSKSTKALGTEKQHKCEDCEYSTEWQSHLMRHNRIHTNERPYACEVCEKRFTRKEHLNDHMKTHRAMFAFQCFICHQGFVDERQRKLHQNRCKTKGYECYLCKKFNWNKQHLVDHMRAHSGKNLRCSKCRKKFSTDLGLARHMKIHGKLFQFQCSNCRQGFSDENQWKSHESRCKSKQFECYLCRKKFYQGKCGFLMHMRHKHTGEKPFSCSYCPMRFCHKSNLTRHSKSCH